MFLPKKQSSVVQLQIQFSLLSYCKKKKKVYELLQAIKQTDRGINSSKALVFKIKQDIMSVFIKQGKTAPALPAES